MSFCPHEKACAYCHATRLIIDDYLASAYIKAKNGDAEGAARDITSAREAIMDEKDDNDAA